MVIQGFFPGGRPHLPALAREGSVQPNAFPLPPSVRLGRSSGRPLAAAVQSRMESLFRTSFADVRVHVGPEPLAVGALAFTAGSDIYFAPSHYAPDTPRGRRLLAHELTHVVQQRTGKVRAPAAAGISVVHDPGLEAEAERMSLRAVEATPPPTSAAPAAAVRARATIQARTRPAPRVPALRRSPVLQRARQEAGRQGRRPAPGGLLFVVLPGPAPRPAAPAKSVVQRAPSATRVLRKDQVYRSLPAYQIIVGDGLIREVIGYSMMPEGNVKDALDSFYSFVRKGGKAGYQGLTKNPLSHVAEIRAVLQEKGGGVIAAIDLGKVTAPKIDLTDSTVASEVKTTLFQRGKNLNLKIPQLAGEGVVAVGGQILADAVTALVNVPGDITQENLYVVLQRLMYARATTSVVSQHLDQPWPNGEPRYYIQQSEFEYDIKRLGTRISVKLWQDDFFKKKEITVTVDRSSGEISMDTGSHWSKPELEAIQEEALRIAEESLSVTDL